MAFHLDDQPIKKLKKTQTNLELTIGVIAIHWLWILCDSVSDQALKRASVFNTKRNGNYNAA